MHRYLSLGLSLAVISCLDPQSLDASELETETSSATVTPATTLTANPAVHSGVRIALWRASTDSGMGSFWPAGARTVQVIMTAGDAGDVLTGFHPTTYVWIVKNGSSVYKVWRVQTSQLGGAAGFMTRLNIHFAAAESGPSNGASHVILGSTGTKGPRGPHIGPGGGGEFTLKMVTQVLATAGEISNFADVTANELPVFN